MSRSIPHRILPLMFASATSVTMLAAAPAQAARAAVSLTQVSSGPYFDSQAQHATEV